MCCSLFVVVRLLLIAEQLLLTATVAVASTPTQNSSYCIRYMCVILFFFIAAQELPMLSSSENMCVWCFTGNIDSSFLEHYDRAVFIVILNAADAEPNTNKTHTHTCERGRRKGDGLDEESVESANNPTAKCLIG